MAYKTVINKAVVSRAAAMAEIETQLLAMGWLYVDGKVTAAADIPYTDVHVTNNTFTKVGHTLVNSDPVYLSTTGTAPGGLSSNTRYYVVGVAGDTFQLATTYNGSAINITSQGTGNHTISAAYRVFKSNGINADKPYQYVRFSFVASNVIQIIPSYNWNLTTRGVEGSNVYATPAEITTNETGFYIWIHGDKDKFSICTKVVSTYYRCMAGFMKPFFPLQTTLTGDATAGSNVVLNVASSTGFEVGYSYQIIGMNAEGRDHLTVTAIGTGTITVSSLPRNYGTGALFGTNPCHFVAMTPTLAFACNPMGAVGLTDYTSWGYAGVGASLIPVSDIDPDYKTSKYVLQPLATDGEYSIASSYISSGAYMENRFLLSPSTGMVIEDTFAVGRLDSGTSSGEVNTNQQLNDLTKSWVENAYANKVVIITFGLGSGMIKKINSNTATAILLSGEWIFDSIPDGTSQYIICDEGYRYMANGSGAGSLPQIALQEGIE